MADLWRALRESQSTIAQAALGLLGWACLTVGLAQLFGDVVWCFSVGLLCFALFGFRMLGIVASQGVYALTRPEDRK